MLDGAWLLLMNSVLLMLRITPGDSFPKPLSAAEERELLRRWEEEQDAEARNILVEHNLRLVAHIVKKYHAQTDEADDLISIGTIGLIKGINTYRSDRGVRLTTYASRCVENELLMYFRSRRKQSGDISLSEELNVDGDGNSLSMMDVVADESDMTENLLESELISRLHRAVETGLGKREAEIVRLRYGLGGRAPMTQQETAEQCGISRSYVSRIEKKALERLRELLRD